MTGALLALLALAVAIMTTWAVGQAYLDYVCAPTTHRRQGTASQRTTLRYARHHRTPAATRVLNALAPWFVHTPWE